MSTHSIDLRQWARDKTAWNPNEATHESDGMPDVEIVPYVEELLRQGVFVYQSCAGHSLTDYGNVRRSGGLWFNHPTFDPNKAVESEQFEQVARLYGRESFPIWEVTFVGMAEGPQKLMSAMIALWDAIGLPTRPPHYQAIAKPILNKSPEG